MSKFCGKCDLYDSLPENPDINKIRLFIEKDGRSYPIKLEEPRDLIPYYPYVPFMSTGDGQGHWCAWLTDSYIDREEKGHLKWQIEDLICEYKKSKRNKTPFSPDSKWYDTRLIERVKEKGEKATTEGIHLSMQNYYRKELAKEMEANGYEDMDIIKWVYPDMWVTKLTSGWDWRTDEY